MPLAPPRGWRPAAAPGGRRRPARRRGRASWPRSGPAGAARPGTSPSCGRRARSCQGSPPSAAGGPASRRVPVVTTAPGTAASGRSRPAQRRRRGQMLAEGRDAPGRRSWRTLSGRIGLGREGEPGLQRRVGGAAGHRTEHQFARRTRCVRSVRSVTTPKLPPPPRSAQKRSGSWVGVDPSPPAVGGHDVKATTLSSVSPKARPASPMPPPSASPPSADRGARAGRDRDAVGGQGRVDVHELRAGAGAHPPAAVAQAHRAQAAQVQHDARVGRRVARVAVAARAGHDGHVVPSRPAHGRLHVGDVAGPDDGDRMAAVPARVVDVRRRAEAALPGRQDGPPHGGRERAHRRLRRAPPVAARAAGSGSAAASATPPARRSTSPRVRPSTRRSLRAARSRR